MYGLCKLTRTKGAFVKSHLLPKALTRPSNPGSAFVEYGMGRRPVRRWDSWFDNELVTRRGEDILSEIDGAGIAELRRLGLVWSGRRKAEADPVPDFIHEESGVGMRIIADVNIHSLGLFFLSLLWRWAASKRPEAAKILIPIDRLEKLRCMLVEKRHTPVDIYPLMLTQLSQIGAAHNHAPMAMTMAPVILLGKSSRPIPVFRFYLDGLVANFIRKPLRTTPPFPFDEKGNRLVIMTQTTDKSFQMQNMEKAVIESYLSHPGVMAKI